MKKHHGFSLIELVIVIVIISILASFLLPKFIELRDRAHAASVTDTGNALQSSINQVHYHWILNGSGTRVEDLNNVSAFESASALDLNTNGFPIQDWHAGSQEPSPTANNDDDCLTVFTYLLDSNSPTAHPSNATSSDYLSKYEGTNICKYTYKALPTLSITYNANSGKITIDNDYTS